MADTTLVEPKNALPRRFAPFWGRSGRIRRHDNSHRSPRAQPAVGAGQTDKPLPSVCSGDDPTPRLNREPDWARSQPMPGVDSPWPIARVGGAGSRARQDRVLRGLVLQPEIVTFMVAGRLAVGSGRHEHGLAGGVATTTSAAGACDRRQAGTPGRRTGAGSRCRSAGSPLAVPDGGRAR